MAQQRKKQHTGLPATLTPRGKPLVLKDFLPDPAMAERMDLLDGVDRARSLISQAEADLVRGREGVPVCRDGCGKCCLTEVPLATGLEAQHALSTMTRGDGITTEVLQRARDWLTHKHVQAPTYPRARPAVLLGQPNAEFTREELAQLKREQFALAATACPFLDKATMGCTVYDQRPFACRTYSVTVAPDDFCERPRDAYETMHPGEYMIRPPDVGAQVETTVNALHEQAGKHHVGLGAGGFWPTVLYATYAGADFVQMVERGEVALAKLANLPPGNPYPGTLSQGGLEQAIAVQSARERQALTSR